MFHNSNNHIKMTLSLQFPLALKYDYFQTQSTQIVLKNILYKPSIEEINVYMSN